MANIKISELNSLTEKDYTDVLPIVDTSANETKKISIEELVNNNVSLVAVSSTAPSGMTQGEMYYNTTNNKIYTYVGGGEYFDNGEPKEGIFYIVFDKQSTYAYDGETLVSVGGGAGGGGSVEIGTIVPFAGSTAPDNFLMCDGSAVSRTTYADLFDVIGTTFGSGDGSTTFNLPNLKGRVPVGLDGTQTEFDTLGETGGSKYLQEHRHKEAGSSGNMYYETGNYSLWTTSTTFSSTYSSYTENPIDGSGNAIPTGDSGNLQPYIVVNYIIKVSETTPRSSETVNTFSNSTKDAYACDYTNNQLANINDRFVIATNTTYDASHGNITITGGHTFNSGALYVDANSNENTFDLYGRIVINIASSTAGTITLADTGLRPTFAKTFYVGISQNSDTNTVWNVTATLNTNGTITIPILNLGQTTGTRNIIISNSIHFID